MEIVLNELGLGLLLGLVALVTFFVANLFTKSLTPKSYDQVLEELKVKEKRSPEKSPKKKAKKAKKVSLGNESDDEVEQEQGQGHKPKAKANLTVQIRQQVTNLKEFERQARMALA
jgi:hypothetical protein